MSTKTYQIPPLDWRYDDEIETHISLNNYRVMRRSDGQHVAFWNGWLVECDSIDHGKQLAEAHHRAELEKHLIEVSSGFIAAAAKQLILDWLKEQMLSAQTSAESMARRGGEEASSHDEGRESLCQDAIEFINSIYKTPACSCRKCQSSLERPFCSWTIVCETCGKKRCPHASDHTLPCTPHPC